MADGRLTRQVDALENNDKLLSQFSSFFESDTMPSCLTHTISLIYQGEIVMIGSKLSKHTEATIFTQNQQEGCITYDDCRS